MGMALDPQFTTGRPYSTRSTPTTPPSAARRRAGTTTAPTRPAPSATAAWSAAGSRRSCPTATEVAADQRRVVPAVPEPLGRRPAVRPRRRALRHRRRRRQLHVRRLRPGRRAGQPVRRPPAAVGGAQTAADRRGRRAAQPGPAHHRRPDRARRRADPRRPRHRRPAARQPGHRRRSTPAGSSPTASATRSASRSGPAPPTPTSATSAGSRGRRSTASRTPTRRSATTAGRATRATARQSGYDALGLNICDNLYAAGERTSRRCTRTTTARKVAGESCPIGSSSISGIDVLRRRDLPAAPTTARCSSPTTRAAASGSCSPDADGLPEPGHAAGLRRRARLPGRPRDGPGRRPLLRRRRRRHDQPHPRDQPEPGADRGVHGDPDERRRAARRSTSTPAARATRTTTRSTYAWDLDGDGAFDDSTGATPSRTYTQEGHVTVRLRVTDPGGLADTEQRELTVGTPPTPTISAPAGGTTYAVGDTVSFSGSADVPALAPAPLDRRPAPLLGDRADELPRPPHPGLRRRRLGLVRLPRPRVPVVPHASA